MATSPSMRLLVEGDNDFNVIKHLLIKRNQDFGLGAGFKGIKKPELKAGSAPSVEVGGLTLLLVQSRVYLQPQPDPPPFGMIVDADADLGRRWSEVRKAVEPDGYILPERPDPIGTIVPGPSADHPRLGIWLMPDNLLPGMLEDLVVKLIPDGDLLLGPAEEAVERARSLDQRFPDLQRCRALIHTWLAWQKTPGRPMGIAIAERWLDPDSPHADAFLGWLDRLHRGDVSNPDPSQPIEP